MFIGRSGKRETAAKVFMVKQKYLSVPERTHLVISLKGKMIRSASETIQAHDDDALNTGLNGTAV
jgi:hypothetical protein